MVIKYTENNIVSGYSYIFLLHNSSKVVLFSAKCALQSLCPSVRLLIFPSTYTHDTVRIFMTLDTEKL